MPRRLDRSPRPGASNGAAPVPKAKALAPGTTVAARRGFEPGAADRPQVALRPAPKSPEAVAQRAVHEVRERHPESVVKALARLDALPGVEVQSLGEVDGLTVPVARVKGAPAAAGTEPRRVLITGGVHGSESAGALSAVQVLALVAAHPERFPGLELTVVPLVNPEGFRNHTRQNENEHADLNREVVRDGSVPKEIELVLPVLDEGPWSLSLDLHASGAQTANGSSGFFAIRTEGNAELLHEVMSHFDDTFPVLNASTERYQMVEPGVMESHNQGTVKGYLFEHGTRAAFTLEAPEWSGLDQQVKGLTELVQAFISRI